MFIKPLALAPLALEPLDTEPVVTVAATQNTGPAIDRIPFPPARDPFLNPQPGGATGCNLSYQRSAIMGLSELDGRMELSFVQSPSTTAHVTYRELEGFRVHASIKRGGTSEPRPMGMAELTQLRAAVAEAAGEPGADPFFGRMLAKIDPAIEALRKPLAFLIKHPAFL